MIIELIGGMVAGSLAIMTDAAHLLSDASGFLISIGAIYVSKKRPTLTFNHGYHRAEILGAFGSIVFIWFLTLWLIYEAIDRVYHPEEINAPVMIFTAAVGLVINLVMFRVLHSPLNTHHNCGHDHGHDEREIKIDIKEECKHDHHDHDHDHSHKKHKHGHKEKKHKKHHHEHEHHHHTHDHHDHHKDEHHKHDHHDEENINIKAALVHVIGDFI